MKLIGPPRGGPGGRTNTLIEFLYGNKIKHFFWLFLNSSCQQTICDFCIQAAHVQLSPIRMSTNYLHP